MSNTLKLFPYQKEVIKAIASTDKHTIHYFPRNMGKSFANNYIKKVGKAATNE